MAGGLGFLAGLGQAAQGLPQGLGKVQELAQQQAQLDEMARAHRANEEYRQNAGMTDVGQLFQVLGLPQENLRSIAGQGPMKLPTPTAQMLVTKTLADQEQQKGLARGGMMAETLERQNAGGQDPYLSGIAQQLRVGGYNPEKHAALMEKVQEYTAKQAAMQPYNPWLEKMGIRTPQAPRPTAPQAGVGPPQIVPTGGMGPETTPSLSAIAQQGQRVASHQPEAGFPDAGGSALAADEVGRSTQRVAQLPGAQTAAIPSAPVGGATATPAGGPPSGMEGMQQDFSIQLGNGMTVHVKPTPKATVGDQYIEAVKAVQALEDANVPPTDPRYLRAAKHMDRLKFSALGPGGSLAGPSGLGPLAKGETPPVQETVVQDLRGQARIRRAAQEVEQALTDPNIDKYIGPYGQYGSQIQGRAPFAALGKVPVPVVQLEQNLNTIKNYTIKLITGAQMSEQEAKRIVAELPDQGTQPGVFRQRFKTTQENIRVMEEMTRRLALRGDQQAILTATEFGLLPSGQQGKPPAAGAPSAGKRAAIGPEGEGMLPVDTDLSKFPGYRWK